MNWIEHAWYQKDWKRSPVSWLLLPLTLLFWCLSSIRRQAYQLKLKKSTTISAPVIVVGNISVGGNGKTPLVIRLAEWLKQNGYHPGVVSRGYGGKSSHYPLAVEGQSDPKEVGDEPVLMRQHLGCPLVVDPKRPRGAQYLVDEFKCDIIICDDGLQHYALDRDVEIVVMDGIRRTGNGVLLPSGPLREGQWRLDTVDFVVNNGGEVSNGEHLMSLEPGRLVNVKYANQSMSVQELNKPVTAVAAIGNPERFFSLLRTKQVKLKSTLSFADHHQFSAQDIPQDTVLMTEKDAVKCKDFAFEDWWYLPVNAKLSEQFKQQLLAKLDDIKHKRN